MCLCSSLTLSLSSLLSLPQAPTNAVTVWVRRRSAARRRLPLRSSTSETDPTPWARSPPCPSSGTSTRTWLGKWRWGGRLENRTTCYLLPSDLQTSVQYSGILSSVLFCLLCSFEIILCFVVAGERALRVRVAEVSGKCSGGLYVFVYCVWPRPVVTQNN